jgi:hypothetical protein
MIDLPPQNQNVTDTAETDGRLLGATRRFPGTGRDGQAILSVHACYVSRTGPGGFELWRVAQHDIKALIGDCVCMCGDQSVQPVECRGKRASICDPSQPRFSSFGMRLLLGGGKVHPEQASCHAWQPLPSPHDPLCTTVRYRNARERVAVTAMGAQRTSSENVGSRFLSVLQSPRPQNFSADFWTRENAQLRQAFC